METLKNMSCIIITIVNSQRDNNTNTNKEIVCLLKVISMRLICNNFSFTKELLKKEFSIWKTRIDIGYWLAFLT